MALKIITLEEMKAHSGLGEVQALTETTLAPLEATALDLLEAELGRRLTVDSVGIARRVPGSGMAILPLPEHLDTMTCVVSDSQGDITSSVEIAAAGWLLASVYPHRIIFRESLTITGLWGISCPGRVKGVLLEVIEALVVRRGDPVSRRDELSPWGAVSDGGLRADRDSSRDRKETLENLLRHDVKVRLQGFYRPDIVAVV